MRIIAIANQKGGCGKTTTAINLSSAIAKLGKRILLIDLDPQAHASFGLGYANPPVDKSIYNVLTDNSQKNRKIADCIIIAAENLDIIPSNILLSTLEQELKDTEGAVSRLHEKLGSGGLTYDYVVIDCPPSLGFLTFNALRAADLVMVPIDMSAFSLMGVGKLLGMIELIKIKINHAPNVRALATLFDKRLKYSQTMLDNIRSLFKEQTLETVIRNNVTLKKAVAEGISVLQFDPKANGATDHIALAHEIIRMEGAEEFKQALAEVTEKNDKQEEVTLPQASRRFPAVAQTKIEERPAVQESETTFSISAPNAKDVYIVGDFNHWKMNDSSRLSRLDDGKWEKRFTLSPGKYRYKFVVDGEWVLDSENAEKEQNPFGTYDSVKKF